MFDHYIKNIQYCWQFSKTDYLYLYIVSRSVTCTVRSGGGRGGRRDYLEYAPPS